MFLFKSESLNSQELTIIESLGLGIEISKKVFEDKFYKFSFYDIQSDKTVVSFNAVKGNKKTIPFAFKIALESGCNLISVNQEKNTYYQGLSQIDFERCIEKLKIQPKNTYFYGSSLGGHAAIYYGSIYDANILAGAPKNPADPRFYQSSYPEPRLGHSHLDYAELYNMNNATVLYDEYCVHDSHIALSLLKPHHPYSNYINVPFGGHSLLSHIQQMGFLKKIFHDFIGNKIDANYTIPVNIETPTSFYCKMMYFIACNDQDAAYELVKNNNMYPMMTSRQSRRLFKKMKTNGFNSLIKNLAFDFN